MSKRYPAELRERAVLLVQQTRGEYKNTSAALRAVAAKLGVGTESLRTWVRQDDTDAGTRPGITTAEPGLLQSRVRSRSALVTRVRF